MPMAVPIARSVDICAGISTHLYVPVPPPPVPVPTVNPALEVPIIQAWPPGVGLGSVKKTSTVLHDGLAIIQAGHDCGKLIPQVTYPPLNSLFPKQLIDSKRKVVLNCFSVRMDKQQTGCACPWIPMLTCGQPVSMPLTLTLSNICVNVSVGASGADFVAAFINVAGTMVIDYIFYGKKGPAVDFWKALLGAELGLRASLVQHLIDPRYPIKTEVSIEGPLGITFKAGVSCGSSDTANNPSQVTVGFEKKLAEHKPSGSSVKAGVKETYTWDADGDKKKEGHKVEAGLSTASPAGSTSAGVSYENRPGLPEGERQKLTAKGEAKGPGYSVTTQGNYNPDAAPGQTALTAIWGPPL